MTRLVSRRDQLIQGQIELIDTIYSAVLQPERWSDLMTGMSKVLGGCPALIYRAGVPRRTRASLASGVDPALMQAYIDYYVTLNPWEISTGGDRPPLMRDDELLEDGEIERSEFYNDWCRPQGDLRYSVNIYVPIGPDQTVELVSTRSRRNGPFDDDECRLMLSLIPHLQRAVTLQNMLEVANATQTASTKAFRRFGTGLLLVDASSRVLFMDAEAEILLSSGGAIRVRGGRLVGATALKGRLAEAIARATGHGQAMGGRTGTQLTLPREPDERPLSVSISPLDKRDAPQSFAGPLAMVVVSIPERQGSPNAVALQAALGLTPAEAKLVAALCRGLTLAGYAQANGISLNTAKTHLKRIFDKTGVTRQADLVRRITSDVALRLVL